MNSGARQGCPISLLLYNFIIDEVVQDVLRDLQEVDVELVSSEKLCDLDYAVDLRCLVEPTEYALSTLDNLSRT